METHGKGRLQSMLLIGRDAVSGLAASVTTSVLSLKNSFTGFDFRILVIDNKLVAAAKRVPAMS
jgi:cyanophycin synthetase